ncbi:MAG: oxygen-dependent protoporphyrinogen oxidase [Caeruleum heppii]|nr:MAG: oxygen-dependent protoporphyrinogen oxidase [Caeruleum heppii]
MPCHPLRTASLRCLRRPMLSSPNSTPATATPHHRYSTTSPPPESQSGPPKDIAIIGGGITGLVSAYILTVLAPSCKVTLYEASARLGGWVQSKRVDVGSNGTLVLEQGPRTLRPHTVNGRITLALIRKLGLGDEIVSTPNTAPAALNRYVYFPDHLVQLPGPSLSLWDNLGNLVREPVFSGAFYPALLGEYFRPRRHRDMDDESVADFLRRRLGDSRVADNLVSAVLHGIYAGDVNRLSAKSLFPLLWYWEGLQGSIVKGYLDRGFGEGVPVLESENVIRTILAEGGGALEKSMEDVSVYTFKQGLGTLTEALVRALRKAPNVRIETEREVAKILPTKENDAIEIHTKNPRNLPVPPRHTHTHAICTLNARTLASLTPYKIAALADTSSVTVMVVNLYYTNPSLLPVQGFGYLLPRSVPFDQNPERALGVVFDSEVVTGQDTAVGTKLTVMLGGHWWDGWDSYPDPEEGVRMAKSILRRHLQIRDEPLLTNATLQRDCIPQYHVGHERRMLDAHRHLLAIYKGRLRVAGNSYTGVGLNDCVRAGQEVAGILVRPKEKPGDPDGPVALTGLEDFLKGMRVWVTPKKTS